MDLTVRTQNLPVGDRGWLRTDEGTDTTQSITLDGALMGAIFTDGIVPSGVLLGVITATGRYTRYNHSGVDGEAVFKGVLAHPVRLNRFELGDAASTYHNVGAALQWQIDAIIAKLPANSGWDATHIVADSDSGVQARFQ